MMVEKWKAEMLEFVEGGKLASSNKIAENS